MMSHGVTVALERVRWKLLRAYQALAERGALREEQLREVEALLERLDEVPTGQVRRRLMELADQARKAACSDGEARAA